jgi:membrane protein YdbS with pleckstrin-like domain
MSVHDQLQPGEEILYQAFTTRISLIPRAALAALVAAAAIYAWRHDQTPLAVALGAIVAVFALWALWGLLLLRANEYVLTDHRLILQTGVLAKRSMDSRLDKINNVEHRQTLWGRILGFGDLEIDTASETGAALFPRIQRPLDFKRAILGAVEDYRARLLRPLPAAAPAPQQTPPPPGTPPAERIRQLKALLDDGLISPQEFEAKRRQLLEEI